MPEETIKQQYLEPESEYVTMDDMRAFVNSSMTNFSGNFRIKSGSVKADGGIIELSENCTVDGRTAAVLSAAIDASGHFADSTIDTASGTILADFTFGASGAIQIGEYVNGVSGDIKISPAGILGRNSTGATTFSVNGTTGVAVLNGLVVGTNVNLGTAEDSAGVTTIVGNTVTTGYVNALNVTAQYVAASISISSPTITGGTIRTNVATYPYAVMTSTGFTVNGQYMTFNLAGGTAVGEVYGDSTHGLLMSSFSGKQCYVNGANNLILNAGGGTLQLRHGNTTRAYTSSNSLIISSGMTLGGTRRTTWPSASFSCSNLNSCNISDLGSRSHASLTGVVSSQHHSSTSAGLNITPNSISCANLTASSYIRLGSGDPIYWSGTSYYIKHNGTDFLINDTIKPTPSNSKYCGTSGNYWHRVYSDAYFTKNTTFQTFDKYDDLQILRDLKFGKDNKLVLKNLPKEIHDKGFINFGGMASFNLCASRKIVECIDDLKKTIDNLKDKIKTLESKTNKKI